MDWNISALMIAQGQRWKCRVWFMLAADSSLEYSSEQAGINRIHRA